ncbi:MAG: histidine kinase dimerization/phospho-acceptor domain-containing protein, partial [Campylobacterales bacterium]
MSGAVDTKLRESDRGGRGYQWEVFLPLAIFGVAVVLGTSYLSLLLFSKQVTNQFKSRVTGIVEEVKGEYRHQLEILRKSGAQIANSPLFLEHFQMEPEVVEAIFKMILTSNPSLSHLVYLDRNGKGVIGCWKRWGTLWCQRSSHRWPLPKKGEEVVEQTLIANGKLVIEVVYPVGKGRGFIGLEGEITPLLNRMAPLHWLLLDREGRILAGDFLKGERISDLFNYRIVQEIGRGGEGFISDELYLTRLGPFKLLIIQNRELLEQANRQLKESLIWMVALSTGVALILGFLLSSPISRFYEELEERVQREVAKRREKEQLLLHQSKLATLGEMLGNIAHQWRHPLTRLSLLIQNLELAYQQGALTPARFQRFKERADLQIKYMSDTIDDFINFFRRDREPVQFYPSQLVREILQLSEGRLNQKRVKVELEVEGEVPIVGYRSEFAQVLLNIINNGIDILEERKIP